MGQAVGGHQEHYNEEELLRQLALIDPTFRYEDYVDGNCTLQEVISIRQCFLDLRDEYESEDPTDPTNLVSCSDPPETIQARKLRSIPFLSNEEIAQIGGQSGHEQVTSQIEEQDQLLHPRESEELGRAEANNMSVLSVTSARAGSRRGITTAM